MIDNDKKEKGEPEKREETVSFAWFYQASTRDICGGTEKIESIDCYRLFR